MIEPTESSPGSSSARVSPAAKRRRLRSDAGEPDSAEPTEASTVTLDGAALTVARWGDDPAEIVLLHDGLGSIGQWRTIPGQLAAETGRTVLAYDRPGHGHSTPAPTGAWPSDWLHLEAERFGRLVHHLGDAIHPRPLLVGHSDGGSIALLHAAGDRGRPVPELRGLITLAAHTWVEQACVDGIVDMVNKRDLIVAGLVRSHAEPARVFDAWSGVWLSDDFRPWDVRDRLSPITCPTVVAQGRNDEYATPAHATETAEAIGPNATAELLDDVGHLLHHQDPELVVRVVRDAIHRFEQA